MTRTENIRKFETGATRSPDAGRYDPEGFLSPIVIERFCEYMNKHRVQSDGSVRGSDNWQKGMPFETYIKGHWRHFLHLWTRYRGYQVMDPGAAADMEEDLCAIMFNVGGMLFELLKDKRRMSLHISRPEPVAADDMIVASPQEGLKLHPAQEPVAGHDANPRQYMNEYYRLATEINKEPS